jgi:hypothetical protein
MLREISVVFVFFAMLIAPCLITLRSQDAEDDAPASPITSAQPVPRTR